MSQPPVALAAVLVASVSGAISAMEIERPKADGESFLGECVDDPKCGTTLFPLHCLYPLSQLRTHQACPAMCGLCNSTTSITTTTTTTQFCSNAKHEWIFQDKCYYSLRCRNGKVDRLAPDAQPIKCNCNTLEANGAVNNNCYSCNIFAGELGDRERNPSWNPMVLTTGINKARFTPFKTPEILEVGPAWFRCTSCRNGRLLYRERCITVDECIAQRESLAIYSVNQYNGKCEAPFECIDGKMSTTHKKCKCPRVMRGCTHCSFGALGEQGNDDAPVTGPVCRACKAGKVLVAAQKNFAAPVMAFRYGTGVCRRPENIPPPPTSSPSPAPSIAPSTTPTSNPSPAPSIAPSNEPLTCTIAVKVNISELVGRDSRAYYNGYSSAYSYTDESYTAGCETSASSTYEEREQQLDDCKYALSVTVLDHLSGGEIGASKVETWSWFPQGSNPFAGYFGRHRRTLKQPEGWAEGETGFVAVVNMTKSGVESALGLADNAVTASNSSTVSPDSFDVSSEYSGSGDTSSDTVEVVVDLLKFTIAVDDKVLEYKVGIDNTPVIELYETGAPSSVPTGISSWAPSNAPSTAPSQRPSELCPGGPLAYFEYPREGKVGNYSVTITPLLLDALHNHGVLDEYEFFGLEQNVWMGVPSESVCAEACFTVKNARNDSAHCAAFAYKAKFQKCQLYSNSIVLPGSTYSMSGNIDPHYDADPWQYFTRANPCRTEAPTATPTIVPTTLAPTTIPSVPPTAIPSVPHTAIPSATSSSAPSGEPSQVPLPVPSLAPTSVPSEAVSSQPSGTPSIRHTGGPSSAPSNSISPTSSPTCSGGPLGHFWPGQPHSVGNFSFTMTEETVGILPGLNFVYAEQNSWTNVMNETICAGVCMYAGGCIAFAFKTAPYTRCQLYTSRQAVNLPETPIAPPGNIDPAFNEGVFSFFVLSSSCALDTDSATRSQGQQSQSNEYGSQPSQQGFQSQSQSYSGQDDQSHQSQDEQWLSQSPTSMGQSQGHVDNTQEGSNTGQQQDHCDHC